MNVRVISPDHIGCASAILLTRLNHTVIGVGSACRSAEFAVAESSSGDRRPFAAANRSSEKVGQIPQTSGAIDATRKATSRPPTANPALRLAVPDEGPARKLRLRQRTGSRWSAAERRAPEPPTSDYPCQGVCEKESPIQVGILVS
jgi:hypothetical protein